MVPASRLTAEQLRDLAEDAHAVVFWAFRMRMPKDQQIAETVKAFEVRLGYRQPEIPSNGAPS